ncbi:MAG: hypothetical protein CMM87_03750 [Rickettsiales bacterium]|nr:hypothetical protein [Rickettsiales bacterium]
MILPVFHTSDDGVPFIPTGYVYLAFKDEASDEKCSEIVEENNIQITEVITDKSFFVKFPLKVNTVKLADTIARRYESFIIHVVPEFSTNFKTAFLPNSARFNNQWHLKNTGQHRGTSIGFKAGADARVVKAWEFLNSVGKNPFGKDHIKIAVIDDGFDITHPSLSHKIVDPFNASTGAGGNVSPSYKEWHGTAVAGVAAASTIQGEVVGVAPNAKIIPIKFGKGLSDREIILQFKWAHDHGADVISCSWGAAAKVFPLSPAVKEYFRFLVRKSHGDKGIPILFAAGNDGVQVSVKNPKGPGYIYYNGFATHPDIIAVGASDSMDKMAHYSNYGPEVAFLAPSSGVMGITTCDVQHPGGYNPQDDYTDTFGGTSSACPLAAGGVALMLSLNEKLTTEEIRKTLIETTRGIKLSGKPIQATGCIDIESALKRIYSMLEAQ